LKKIETKIFPLDDARPAEIKFPTRTSGEFIKVVVDREMPIDEVHLRNDGVAVAKVVGLKKP
jgi:hypothetical protein